MNMVFTNNSFIAVMMLLAVYAQSNEMEIIFFESNMNCILGR